MNLSVIIPALNEETILDQSLAELNRVLDGRLQYEVIVVDNGSTDNTPHVAARQGAKLCSQPHVTVGAARNAGVALAQAPILAFVDADVLLTNSWANEFLCIESNLLTSPMTVTGSRYDIGRHPSWIERYWYAPFVNTQSQYINSGNLVTTKVLHEAIGGFSQTLSSGEDFDYCQRARAAGATIISNAKLHALHEGNPKTLRAFVRREMWHGQGDAISVSAILRSQVAVCALLFFLLHIAVFCGAIFLRPTWIAAAALALLALCFACSLRRSYRNGIITILVNTYIYYFYFLGRSVSLFHVASSPQAHRVTDQGHR